MSLSRVSVANKDAKYSKIEFLPGGRFSKFPEGSLARQYEDAMDDRKFGADDLEFETDNPNINQREEFPRQVTFHGIGTEDRMRNIEYTFEQLVSLELQHYFEKEYENMPQFFRITIPHWLSQATIRSMVRRFHFDKHMLKKVSKIIFDCLMEVSKATFKTHTEYTKLARDLGTMTQEEIDANNVHNLPLPVTPRKIGDFNNDNTDEMAREFIDRSSKRCIDSLVGVASEKRVEKKLFHKSLEAPKPYQGFDRMQFRRNPQTMNERIKLPRAKYQDPAELFGVDASTLDLPDRDYYFPRQ